MSKYGARKTVTADGLVHDSAKEARRWAELKLLERAGEIFDLQRQVPFVLIPPQDGERACRYVADFVYTTRRGDPDSLVVEDCKGYRTDVYRIKRKLMLWVHKIKIKET